MFFFFMHIVPLMTILMLMPMLDVLSMDVDFVTFNSQGMREEERKCVRFYFLVTNFPFSISKMHVFSNISYSNQIVVVWLLFSKDFRLFFLLLRLFIFVSHQYLSKIVFLFRMHVVDFPLIWCSLLFFDNFFSFLWSNQFRNIKSTILDKLVFAFHSSFIETNQTISIKRKHYLNTITIHRQISGLTFWMQKKCTIWTRQRQRHTNLNTFVALNWTNRCRLDFYLDFFSLSVFVLFFQTVDLLLYIFLFIQFHRKHSSYTKVH